MLNGKELLSLETKLQAVNWLHKGETIKKVASDVGVGEVTVGDWRRKQAKIKNWRLKKDESDKQQTIKTREFEKTSSAPYLCGLHSSGASKVK